MSLVLGAENVTEKVDLLLSYEARIHRYETSSKNPIDKSLVLGADCQKDGFDESSLCVHEISQLIKGGLYLLYYCWLFTD